MAFIALQCIGSTQAIASQGLNGLHCIAVEFARLARVYGLPLWPGTEQASPSFPNSRPLVMVSQLLTIFNDVQISEIGILSHEYCETAHVDLVNVSHLRGPLKKHNSLRNSQPHGTVNALFRNIALGN